VDAGEVLADPWQARNDYIDVVLDRSPESLDRFFAVHLPKRRPLDEAGRIRLLKLLELQRHAMLMYTSCGWFFDELSGLETVQVIMYAGRAIQLAQELFGDHIEDGFLERLAKARSNLPEHGNGADIYRRWVKPAAIDLPKVAAHYAISSLFERYEERDAIFCYDIERQDHRLQESGRARLSVGKARVRSRITQETELLTYGAVHLGDHNINAGVRSFQGDEAYAAMRQDASAAFAAADFPQAIRLLDRHFGETAYNLRSLFKDEQRKIVDVILDSTLEEAESALRQLYEAHAPLLRFLSDMGAHLPKVFTVIAEFVVNSSLRREFESGFVAPERVSVLLDVARRERVALDGAGLSYTLRHSLENMIERLQRDPDDVPLLQRLVQVVAMADALPFRVDLWRVQNRYYEMLRDVRPRFEQEDSEQAREWVRRFVELGESLKIRVPEAQHASEVA